MKLIERYIFVELIPYFVLGNVFFIFLLLFDKFINLSDLFFTRDVPFIFIFETFIFFLPSLLIISFPTSILLASTITFNRITADSETLVLKSSGTSVLTFYKPLFIFALIFFIIDLMMSIFLVPAGNNLAVNNLKVMLRNISIKDINEKQLYEKFPNFLIYVDNKVNNERFNNLLIINKSNQSLIFSKEGKINSNNMGKLSFDLKDGVIIKDDKDISRLDFKNFSINIDLMERKDFDLNDVSFLSMKELYNSFDKNPIYKFQFSSNIALPFSTLIMAFLGFPIGVFYKKNSKTFGIFSSFLIIMLYNLFYILSKAFIFKGFNPYIAAWLPNVCFLFLLTILLYNTRK